VSGPTPSTHPPSGPPRYAGAGRLAAPGRTSRSAAHEQALRCQSRRRAAVADAGLDELAWDVAGSLINFLDLRGYLDDWRHTHEAALAAVRRAGYRRGEACLLRGFG
jgi:hypothetical protein